MGFFSWLLCSILVVALVLLLFPFSVRIEFEAGERGARALFFFFKKKVYEYEKKWGKEQVGSRKSEVESEENVKASTKDKKSEDTQSSATTPVKSETKSSEKKEQTVESPEKTKSVEAGAVEAVAKHPEVTTAEKKAMDPIEAKPLQDDYSEPAAKSEPEEKKTADVKDAAKPALVSEPISTEPASKSEKVKSNDSKSDDSELSKAEKPEKKKPKKEKRKLSDREFWTIILTPDFDARAFRYVLKILGAVFSLFRIRFKDCFVEGIQTDYQTMGYIAAVNGFLKAYPYVGDWDLRMDWCREKGLRAAGTVRLSITLLRVFCFVLETLVLAGILAFSFWRRRARVIKTNELPELGFVRRKILNIILED
ncbi:hypothetical protein [Fibrobacter sp. UWB12]|uniref:hypothetical protein n=1 Tax=Fibrobacter sp. UWB12 TaxID=1896203 RepID=UPI00091726D3|nr:hypothetical protein [Fibrobacter sp. UWB12]SHL02826.1 hypothetical protein SAMN05720759_1149 [Fibrobacter sp. UWB12]